MKQSSFAAVLCLALSLSACGGSGVRDTLGLNHQAPDEFRVVSRPPLSVPPQFNLRPPGSVAGSAAPAPADEQARALVIGHDAPPPAAIPTADTAVAPVSVNPLTTNAEAEFLQRAGAQNADPTVRTHLIEEKNVASEQQEEKPWYDFWSAPKKEPIVNAKGEASRIQTDKDTGQPVTAGDTPVVKAKDTGVLGAILNY